GSARRQWNVQGPVERVPRDGFRTRDSEREARTRVRTLRAAADRRTVHAQRVRPRADGEPPARAADGGRAHRRERRHGRDVRALASLRLALEWHGVSWFRRNTEMHPPYQLLVLCAVHDFSDEGVTRMSAEWPDERGQSLNWTSIQAPCGVHRLHRRSFASHRW